MRSNEKDEVCHSFVVEIFTKSLHRGGVSRYVSTMQTSNDALLERGSKGNWELLASILVVGKRIPKYSDFVLVFGNPLSYYSDFGQ